MTEPHVTSYAPGRWAVFERARRNQAGVILRNYDGSVVLDLGGNITTTVRKDRVAGTFGARERAVDLLEDLNRLERRFEERQAGLHDWLRDARRAVVDSARKIDAAAGAPNG
jgi:hypothetical protein